MCSPLTPNRQSCYSLEPTSQISIHLVIRFADNMRFARGIDTIEEHNKVLEKRGAVWFAKFGKTLGMQHVVRLNKQIKVGIKTHMFLVGKQGREYQWFRARLTEVSRSKPKSDREPMPSYYKDSYMARTARLWLRVSTLDAIPSYESRRLFVKSSGTLIAKSLAASMAGMFIVVEDENVTRAVPRY